MRDDGLGRVVITGLICAVILFGWGCENPNNALDLYLDGILLTEYDDDVEAVHKLEAAVKADKKFWYAWSVLGGVYEKMEDYPRSVAAYEKATAINPDSLKDFMKQRFRHKNLCHLKRYISSMAHNLGSDLN